MFLIIRRRRDILHGCSMLRFLIKSTIKSVSHNTRFGDDQPQARTLAGGGAALAGVLSFSRSRSFSGAFRFRFCDGAGWTLTFIGLAAESSLVRRFFSLSRACEGTSSMSCWLRSGMKTRKSARRSGASLNRRAICLETSS